MEQRINAVAAEVYAIYRETAESVGLTSPVDEAAAIERIAFGLVDSCLNAVGIDSLTNQQIVALSELQIKLRDAMRKSLK